MGNRVPHETHIAREFLACRRLLSQPGQVCGEKAGATIPNAYGH